MRTEQEIKQMLKHLKQQRLRLIENEGKRGNKGYHLPYIAKEIETLEWVLGKQTITGEM